ncbi:MAG: methylmalonyl Co-A mutase-associated GTPase MeaB [Alphaproteobacteria bacterium GM7ARS4]|nr:methylmalonyl Co-A mutase-associated GTPase MeaB [Alphaproteobacteria bacterium GM7ARS4]
MVAGYDSLEACVNALRRGERRALSRAITLIESTHPTHVQQASRLLDQLHRQPKKEALRIGMSGPPGAGKSTFIDALGCAIIQQDQHLAVLAVDPSAAPKEGRFVRQDGMLVCHDGSLAHAGGAILGDKTRMPHLAACDNAFIRPSPSRAILGGIAPQTHNAITLCESAGYDVIIVETVGVGQSEIIVADMVDLFMLVLPPASGDSLQGIKRGIIEVTDILIVNKADGALKHNALRSSEEYHAAMKLLPPKRPYWTAQSIAVSSIEKTGIDHVIQTIAMFKSHPDHRRLRSTERIQQDKRSMWRVLHDLFEKRLFHHPQAKKELDLSYQQLDQQKTTPLHAAHAIMEKLFAHGEKNDIRG